MRSYIETAYADAGTAPELLKTLDMVISLSKIGSRLLALAIRNYLIWVSFMEAQRNPLTNIEKYAKYMFSPK